MMKIPATEIQTLQHQDEGRPAGAVLAYDGGWFWETDTASWRATDSEAADALLERVLVLESEMMDLQHRAQLGDALTQALQATELLEQTDSFVAAQGAEIFTVEA